jgi:hypothetical protein
MVAAMTTASPAAPPAAGLDRQTPAELSALRLAPYAIWRRAALPLQRLVDLTSPAAVRLGERYLDARDTMESLREGLEDGLHCAVPRVEGGLRREALALRRAVHNARSVPLGDGLRRALGDLDGDLQRRVEGWAEAAAEARHCRQALASRLEEEVGGRLRAGLLALARDESFLRPLALASPDFLAAVRRALSNPLRMERTEPDAGALESSRFDRALLTFGIRAAAKTSPFSLFLHQAVVDLTPTAPAPGLDPDARGSRSYLNLGIPYLLRQAAALAGDSAELSVFRLNPTVRWEENGRLEAFVPALTDVAGRLWRSERPYAVRLHTAVTGVLRALPGRFARAELARRLAAAGLDPDATAAIIGKLIDRGVLLADALPETLPGTAPGALAAEVNAWIGDLQRDAHAVAAADSSERAALLAGLREPLDRAARRVQAPPVFHRLTPVLEDGLFDQPLPPAALPPAAGSALEAGRLRELAEALRPSLTLSAPYRVMRDAFVEQHGVGGTATDVVGFLRGVAAFDPLRSIAAAAQQRRDRPERRHRPADGGPRVPLSVFVQPAVEAGRSLLVVNQIHAGAGWLCARLAGEDTAGRRLHERLESWLDEIFSPREPVDFTPCADCNPLQAHPALTRRRLLWPDAPPAAGSTLAVAATTLVHDPSTGLLRLLDPDGREIVPVHLGGSLPHPAWGACFWLIELAQPFRVAMSDDRQPPSPTDGSPVELEHRPRRQVGNIVLARAAWWMHSRRLQRVWLARDGADRLLDVAADRRRLGMPRWLYATAIVPASEVDGSDVHKPLWLDSWNPFGLDLLARQLEHAEWIRLSEALPGPVVPEPAAEAHHLSELLVELAL